jgi:hypothetical protein
VGRNTIRGHSRQGQAVVVLVDSWPAVERVAETTTHQPPSGNARMASWSSDPSTRVIPRNRPEASASVLRFGDPVAVPSRTPAPSSSDGALTARRCPRIAPGVMGR